MTQSSLSDKVMRQICLTKVIVVSQIILKLQGWDNMFEIFEGERELSGGAKIRSHCWNYVKDNKLNDHPLILGHFFNLGYHLFFIIFFLSFM
jgi:hypothetical protein